MKKIAWKTLIVSTIIISIISGVGNNLQNFEECDQNPLLGLSNSDSWSKIVKEERYPFWHCSSPVFELVNDSLYIIGNSYVSKFNTSGIKEWEFLIKLSDFYPSHFSYVFDNDSNLFVLDGNFFPNNKSLIKLNSSGALLFSKELGLQNDYFSLVLGDNNSLLIVGYNYDSDRFSIMKFNNAGQFLWNTSFNIDGYYPNPYIPTDSAYNMYLFFENNSLHNIAKINSSGAIVWQIGLENEIHHLELDSNNNLFIMGKKNYYTGLILKLNSTGNQIKEILIENLKYNRGGIWYLNDLFVIDEDITLISCYDLNLDLKWNFSLSDNFTPYFYRRAFLAKDSHDNVYILKNNEIGNINLIKISSTGELLSRITWGGLFDEFPESLILDLDNNIYFICYCDYYNVWNNKNRCTILVKNPLNGGTPPELRRDLDIRDYFLFSVVGIACIMSPIAVLSILRSNKKRIS